MVRLIFDDSIERGSIFANMDKITFFKSRHFAVVPTYFSSKKNLMILEHMDMLGYKLVTVYLFEMIFKKVRKE